jgi:NAD+ kinase
MCCLLPPQARVLAANRKPLYCTLRTRKRCAVLDGEGRLLRVHHILNECVVDR